MLKKIYRELVAIRTDLIAIRKELQSIRDAMESVKEKRPIMVGIDLCGKDEIDFTPILSTEWEKALERLENASH